MHVETSGAAKCPSPSRLRGRGVDVGLPTLFFMNFTLSDWARVWYTEFI